jgi:phosphoribosyl 1,2-cyclic phosphate phosphodiesterase
MGVPTLACLCDVCCSEDVHDKRTRPSLLLRYGGKNVVVDTTPDFRQQALREKINRLDAVLFTHAHADHIMGLDDIRPYNLKQRTSVPLYATDETEMVLRKTFSYIFDGEHTESTIPSVEMRPIRGGFDLFGRHVQALELRHGRMAVLGFRFGSAAYLTDFSTVPPASKKLLKGLDHLILDALRYTTHPMHSNVEQSLALVEELQPASAWFTHICHDLGHEATNTRLPENVRLAYDGLTLETEWT